MIPARGPEEETSFQYRGLSPNLPATADFGSSRGSLWRKSAVLRHKRRPSPSSQARGGAFHLYPRTHLVSRGSCASRLLPPAALLRFAFGRKICYNIFFSSKANFKIVPKRLLLRRRASPRRCPRNWNVTVLPHCQGLSI